MKNPIKLFTHWLWKRRVIRSLKLLDEVNFMLKYSHLKRQEKRKFWEDFYHKPAFRITLLNKLTNDIYND